MLITVGCLFLIPRVNINMDMTKYLPEDSSMRQGLDIMDKEFPETANANTIRVMFTNLDNKQKLEIQQELSNIRYVDSVACAPVSSDSGSVDPDTADSETPDPAYEKTVGGKTYDLYILSTKYDFHTDEELSIEDAVTKKYEGFAHMKMAIDMNGSELPLWIVGIALAIILLVLFLMCPSFLEPFLFLGAIGCAVLINTGTNAFMPSVSDITNSIAAILQLVLSMDYSIILMNRYRQEKALGGDRVECMKRTIKKAFAPIMSSAFTTIVGLMALAFMRFKIGADLGFVLAKGVFISMISILTILPFLILAFEKGIEKTAKPVIRFPTDKLGAASYKLRYVAVPVFIIIFALVFTLRGNTGIAYTLSDPTDIDNVFPKTNTIVMLYKNNDDEAVQKMAGDLEKNPNINSAISYSNTVGKQYTAEGLKNAIRDMSAAANTNGISAGSISTEAGTNIDMTTLKVLFYDYYKGSDDLKITASAFLRFIADDVVGGEGGSIGGFAINDDMKDQVAAMKKFSSAAALTTPENTSQLASFLGMKKSDVKQILKYYYIKKRIDTHTKMTLPDFVNYITEDLAGDSTIGKQFDNSTKAKLKALSAFTNKDTITGQMTDIQLAQLLGMDQTQVQQILYMAGQSTMAPCDFVDFILNDETIKAGMTEADIANQTNLQTIMHITLSDREFSYSEIAQMLGMSESQTKTIFTLYRFDNGGTDGFKISVQHFLSFIRSDILGNEAFAGKFSAADRADLNMAYDLTNAVVSGRTYTSEEMADLFAGSGGGYGADAAGGTKAAAGTALDVDTVSLLYLYYGSRYDWSPEWKMSIDTLFAFLSENVLEDSRFDKFLTGDTDTGGSDSGSSDSSDFRTQITDIRQSLDDSIMQLKSDNYSRLIINTSYSEEGDDTVAFMKKLTAEADRAAGSGSYYLIGNTPMAYEMMHTFSHEYNKVSIITALFIFLIVLITFRSFIIPVILILLIQCGVYMTVFVTGIQGFDIYYLAMLIVQGILMGATIDYAILYTTYYRESRECLGIRESLQRSYGRSIHTIFTSGFILLLATAVLGRCFANPAVGQICLSIAKGTACALILILFILPGLLAVFDKLIVKVGKEKKNKHPECQS